MTAPRQIIANATYLITRRCSERRLFLRPSDEVNELLLYVLAVASERFGILLHAYCALSNHLHLVLTDPRGNLPAFQQYFASLVARACNGLIRHRESFWDPDSYNAVLLPGAEDAINKIGYALANPVSAGLVSHGEDWPGLRSSMELIGGSSIEVERPKWFFRSDGPMPERASLRLVAPAGIESREELIARVRAEVDRREREAAEKLAAEGRSVQGAERVQAEMPSACARSEEPRRAFKPRIAGLDPEKRAEAIARLKAFLRAYREAWTEFARGVRDVVFPHGTYWMRVAYGVACAPAG